MKVLTDIVKSDNWALAEGEENGKPLYIRFREELREKPDVTEYPRLIRILWKYEPSENGLPSEETALQLRAFEARIVEAVQPSAVAVLVAAITHNGEREWMFYASAVAPFERALNELQEGSDLYPIDVSSAPDPKWTAFYDDILDGLSG
jgi:hypothetical protein